MDKKCTVEEHAFSLISVGHKNVVKMSRVFILKTSIPSAWPPYSQTTKMNKIASQKQNKYCDSALSLLLVSDRQRLAD